MITVVRNAAWIVAWSEAQASHSYIKDADFAFEDGTILQVGGRYDGDADREIDGSGLMVMPGLINIHAHPSGGSLDKGTFDEVGSPALYGHALYSLSPLLRGDEEGRKPTTEVALSELLMSGVTTVCDLGGAYDGWLDLLADSGMRAVAAPGFRQAQWVNVGDHRVDYEWDDAKGRRDFEEALKCVDAAEAHPSGRLSGMVMPAQAETVRPDLIQDAKAAAQDRGVRFQTHAAQTMVEFNELLRRHGKSPVQFLDDLGVLDDQTILGHCIYLDQHSWSPLRTAFDLPTLVDRQVTVAHCPTVFGRTGMTLETFGTYVDAGVNMGMGTDSFPHNMLEEMRHAGYFARIMSGTVDDHSTTDVFNAVTINGAKALGRDDIGRLEAGCKADFVLVDCTHPAMLPCREPIRGLIIQAADRAVRDVYVDGTCVVRDGKVETMDYAEASALSAEAQIRAIERAPSLDPNGRTIDQLAPLAFPAKLENT